MENCFRSSLFISYTINFVSFLLDCRMRQPTTTCGQKFERSLLTAIHYLCRRLKQWVEKMKELSHGQLLINYLVIRYRLFFESCNSFCIQINLDLWFDLFKSQLFFSLMSFWPWKRYINQLMKKALFGIQSFVKFIIQLMVFSFRKAKELSKLEAHQHKSLLHLHPIKTYQKITHPRSKLMGKTIRYTLHLTCVLVKKNLWEDTMLNLSG